MITLLWSLGGLLLVILAPFVVLNLLLFKYLGIEKFEFLKTLRGTEKYKATVMIFEKWTEKVALINNRQRSLFGKFLAKEWISEAYYRDVILKLDGAYKKSAPVVEGNKISISGMKLVVVCRFEILAETRRQEPLLVGETEAFIRDQKRAIFFSKTAMPVLAHLLNWERS